MDAVPMRLRDRTLTALAATALTFFTAAPAVAQSSSVTDLPGVDKQLQALNGQLPANPVTLAAPVQHEGAPTPSAFTPEQMMRVYASDFSSMGPFYFATVSAVEDVRANHPEAMARSMDMAVAINNAAADDPVQEDRALADDHDDLMLTMSDAWGETLGGHFRDAMAEDRLPKTYQLLADYLARGGGLPSTTFPEKYWYGHDRPFVLAPDRIQRHHRAGADDEYSTTPSFPSGHVNQATWKSTLMATMLPELGVQMLARGSEVGYNRVVLGVHYPSTSSADARPAPPRRSTA